MDGQHVQWSNLHGDLGEVAACVALDRSVDTLCHQAGTVPQALAHDLHPDFYSSRLAVRVASELGISAIPVQHHHAHVASLIAERGIARPVIGIALDGVGLGTDGTAWGGEILWVDGGRQAHHWRRLAHLQSLGMPGGDRAVREPWRLAAAVLHDIGQAAEIERRFAPITGGQAAGIVQRMLERNLNCPVSTSAGRWFDTAAAALGLCTNQSREGEAAEALERCAYQFLQQAPDFDIAWQSLDLRPLVASLFEIEPSDTAAVARGAASFHLALVNALAHVAISAAREQGLQDVVLGGGCFVNQVLRARLVNALQEAGLNVHLPAAALCGDTGIALGQAWVAACTLHEATCTGRETTSAVNRTTVEQSQTPEIC